MPSNQKKPKFGDAWKNKKSNPEEMDSLFDKFVHSSKKIAESSQEEMVSTPVVIEPLTQPKADLPDLKIDHDLITDHPKIKEFSATSSNLDPVHSEPGPEDPVQPGPRPNRTTAIKNPVQSGPRPERSPSSLNEVKNYRIPNFVDDEILPTLSPYEQVVLRRLYRLSYGFNKQVTVPVSISKLAEKCNMGESSVKRALKSLEDRGLIGIHILADSGNPKIGNSYLVLRGFISDPVQIGPRSQRTPSTVDHNNDHDDLLKSHDHHQAETMRIYQSITGNLWSKADLVAYEKIKTISLEAIEQGVTVATARAASRPGSLAYFVKEITQIANPSPASRAQRRRELQQIIERVRTAHLGHANYSMAEFSADVKDMCVREGVIFDHTIFNEIVS